MNFLKRHSKQAMIATSIVSLVLLYWLSTRYWFGSEKLLATRPSHTTSPYLIAPRQSYLGVTFEVPYQLVARAAEQSLDASEATKLSGKVKLIGARYDGEITYKRISPVKVSASDHQAMTLSTTLAIEGWVGFNGTIAKSLSMDRMKVDATATITTTVSLGMKPDWSPIASVTVDPPHWNSPPRIKVLGSTITFKKRANAAIEKAISKLPAKIDSALSKLNIKDKVRKAWKVYRFPVSSSSHKANGLAYIEPMNAYFSGIYYLDDELQFSVALGVIASLHIGKSEPPSPHELSNILPLAKIPRFEFNLPVVTEYTALKNVIMTHLGHEPIQLNTKRGVVYLKINEIEIYPSGKRLALGLKFIASTPVRLFDLEGEVFLLASPEISANGQQIFLHDVNIYKDIDNEMWDTFSTLFINKIAQAIEQNVRLDISDDIAKSLQDIHSSLQKVSENSDSCVTFLNETLKLSQITMDEHALVIEGLLKGTLSMALSSNKKCESQSLGL